MILPSLLFALSTLMPAGAPVSWKFTARPADDGLVVLSMNAAVEDGWHIYATKLENDLGPIPTTIKLLVTDDFSIKGDLFEPEAEEVYDPNFQMQVRYHSGSPEFTYSIHPTNSEAFTVKGEVEFMVCNDKTCLPPELLSFTIDIPKREPKP